MEFLSKYRENRQKERLSRIEQEANELYTIECSNRELSYAYCGIPIILIPDDTTAKDIVQKLEGLKQGYITKRKEQHNEPRRIAAAL